MLDTTYPYSIIQLAGKQYLVSPEQTLEVDHLDAEEGQTLNITDVLLYADAKTKLIGTPLVDQAQVTLKVIKHLKGDKIRVATYKSKSRYRKVRGHRQSLTQVQVVKISSKNS